jgi:hypothetical protein
LGSPSEPDRGTITVVARRVLLDALDALADHRDAVTIVGAQAIHLRSVDVDLRVAAYTSDADLSLDPEALGDEPRLEALLTAAGFTKRIPGEPGLWVRTERVGVTVADIGVDLLVPETFVRSPGRRSAEIPPHDRMAARRSAGLEAVAVDADEMDIASLEPDADHRVLHSRVAGPAALLIAKAYKIHERAAQPGQSRLLNKDAGDVVRLMMAVDPEEVTQRLEVLAATPRTAEVAMTGIGYLRALFGAVRTTGTEMAVAALAGDIDEDTIRALAPAYVRRIPF